MRGLDSSVGMPRRPLLSFFSPKAPQELTGHSYGAKTFLSCPERNVKPCKRLRRELLSSKRTATTFKLLPSSSCLPLHALYGFDRHNFCRSRVGEELSLA